VEIRVQILEECAAQASTQQNCERLVYKATRVNLTGKSERRANAFLIASNGFSVTFIADNAIMADEECQYCMEYSKENDFREDVDMQKFDTKTFTPLNPNVVFEFPGRPK
jgi:hypothetical protein